MHALALTFWLLPTALAHRRHYGPGYHSIHHKPLSGSAPYSSIASSAPYGLGNTTTVPGSTGFVTAVSTVSTAIPESSDLGAIDSSAVPSSSIAAINHAGGSGGIGDGSGSSAPCDSGVVTVTENPTFTITVTPGQGSATEVVPSSSDEISASSPLSTKTIPVTSFESSTSSTIDLSTSVVADTSSAEDAAIPASTSEAASTSSLEAIPTSSSSTPKPSLSTVTVVPIPASTSEVEARTPSPSPLVQSTKKQVSATVVSSSAAPKDTTKSSSSGSSPGGCPGKRGIVATAGGNPYTYDQGNISLAYADQPNICWIANWFWGPPPYWPKADPHKQFIPQMYGKTSSVKGWGEGAKAALKTGTKTFLSFGEPEADSANYQSADDAVKNYMTLMQPYATNYSIKLCSPAVLQPPEHLAWLADFLNKCEAAGCIIDMICIHWFDKTSKATPGFPEFKRTVEKAIELGKGKKVWVDNFQANGTPEDVRAFLDEALPYLEKNPNVERYAYVPPLRNDKLKNGQVRPDQFIGDVHTNGTLTSLGQYYADFKTGV